MLPTDVRPGLPLPPALEECRDDGYERHGTVNLCLWSSRSAAGGMARSPRSAPREATPRCCAPWSRSARYPEADFSGVFNNNLDIHTGVALDETLPPQQAYCTLCRLECHLSPRHSSWVNQAVIGVSAFEGSCLSHPVPDTARLMRRVCAPEKERSARRATIKWQCTNRQAHVRLRKLHPVVNNRVECALVSLDLRGERTLCSA